MKEALGKGGARGGTLRRGAAPCTWAAFSSALACCVGCGAQRLGRRQDWRVAVHGGRRRSRNNATRLTLFSGRVLHSRKFFKTYETKKAQRLRSNSLSRPGVPVTGRSATRPPPSRVALKAQRARLGCAAPRAGAAKKRGAALQRRNRCCGRRAGAARAGAPRLSGIVHTTRPGMPARARATKGELAEAKPAEVQ